MARQVTVARHVTAASTRAEQLRARLDLLVSRMDAIEASPLDTAALLRQAIQVTAGEVKLLAQAIRRLARAIEQ